MVISPPLLPNSGKQLAAIVPEPDPYTMSVTPDHLMTRYNKFENIYKATVLIAVCMVFAVNNLETVHKQ